MINSWLNRYTEVKISQTYFSLGEFHGKWTVSRQIKEEVEQFIFPDDSCTLQQMASGNSPDTYYLHKDGTWYRNSTCKDGQWTGYFNTKEEAETIAFKS